ncbi:MAG: hypothetical protein JRI68_00855 [Deltaproteobacteria bacterium]|nr:hypothetical protein [Deltaproteobacteria bacterium]
MGRCAAWVALLLVMAACARCSGGAASPAGSPPGAAASSARTAAADASGEAVPAAAPDASSALPPPAVAEGGKGPVPAAGSAPPATTGEPPAYPETSTPPSTATQVHLYRWEPLVSEAASPTRLAFTAERFTPPRQGQRYAVVDSGRPPTWGRVVQVIRMAQSCELCGLSSYYFVIELPTAPEAIGTPWAVGPLAALPKPIRPSLVPPKATSLRPLADVRVAIDLDGDGDADVALRSASGECARLPPISRGRLHRGHCSFVGPSCAERMARRADGWKAVERQSFMRCSPDHREGF